LLACGRKQASREDVQSDLSKSIVDLGQIVFTTQAGALFGYHLLWSIALGTIAIIVYMEMCGRVAVVAQEPVFAVVRTRLGKRLGLATLIASNVNAPIGKRTMAARISWSETEVK